MLLGTNPVQAAPWRASHHASADVDEHAARLNGWRQEYDQLGDGPFQGALDQLVGDGVQLFRERTSRRLRQRCEVWRDALWCGLTESDDGSRLNGRRAGPRAVMVSGADGSFELVSPEDHAIVGLVVSRAVLARHAPWLVLPVRTDAACLQLEPADRGAALARSRAILALAGGGGGAAPLQQAMLDVVTALLAAAQPEPPERGNATTRRRLVAQVHALLQAEPERAPSVPELCARLHVSRRTLQYAFEEEAGISPLAYLRSVRLNGVRRLLRRAVPGQTVQAAALAWGFWNQSAFAADYRRLFGERASDTLARALQAAA